MGELEKAPLFSIRRAHWRTTPSYHRIANATVVFWLGFEICWRMPWKPQAAYSRGWDAGWRARYMGMASDEHMRWLCGQLAEALVLFNESDQYTETMGDLVELGRRVKDG